MYITIFFELLFKLLKLPQSSLHTEAEESHLYIRGEKLSLQYAAKVTANSNYSSFDITFDMSFKEYYKLFKHKGIKSINARLETFT